MIQPRPAATSEGPRVQSAARTGFIEQSLGIGLLLVLIVGCIVVIRPFATAMLLSVTLCVSTWPVFRWLKSGLGDRRTLAAALLTLAWMLLLVVPLTVLVRSLGDDVTHLTGLAREAMAGGQPPPTWLAGLPLVGARAAAAWDNLARSGETLWPVVAPYLRPLGDWAVQQGAILLSGVAQIAFALILAFFFYRDGDVIEQRLEQMAARIAGSRARTIIGVAGATIVGVVNGVLGTALIQGILLGVSLRLAGVPGAALLGAIGMVLSLVPLGLALLWLPAGLWLLSRGETGWAVFVLAFNGLFVGTLDNFLRPLLISRGIRLPTLLILIGVLGGLISFGIVGLVLGPVLLSVAFTLIEGWGRAVRSHHGKGS